jgi:hypothetical protein
MTRATRHGRVAGYRIGKDQSAGMPDTGPAAGQDHRSQLRVIFVVTSVAQDSSGPKPDIADVPRTVGLLRRNCLGGPPDARLARPTDPRPSTRSTSLFQTGAIRLAQPRAGFRGSRNLRHRVSVAGGHNGATWDHETARGPVRRRKTRRYIRAQVMRGFRATRCTGVLRRETPNALGVDQHQLCALPSLST